MRIGRGAVALALCALGAVALAGCPGEPAPDVEIDVPVGVTPPVAPDEPPPTEQPLPDGWPSDVKIAEYMSLQMVTRVRDDFQVMFHARNVPLTDVVAWFKSTMAENGWTPDQSAETPENAVLPYKKGARKCGISVTNFVLTPAMERDDSSRTVTIMTPAQD